MSTPSPVGPTQKTREQIDAVLEALQKHRITSRSKLGPNCLCGAAFSSDENWAHHQYVQAVGAAEMAKKS